MASGSASESTVPLLGNSTSSSSEPEGLLVNCNVKMGGYYGKHCTVVLPLHELQDHILNKHMRKEAIPLLASWKCSCGLFFMSTVSMTQHRRDHPNPHPNHMIKENEMLDWDANSRVPKNYIRAQKRFFELCRKYPHPRRSSPPRILADPVVRSFPQPVDAPKEIKVEDEQDEPSLRKEQMSAIADPVVRSCPNHIEAKPGIAMEDEQDELSLRREQMTSFAKSSANVGPKRFPQRKMPQ